MYRDDSDLYPGVSSASFASVREKRQKSLEKRSELDAEIFKNGKLVIAEIDKEMKDIVNKLSLLIDNADTEESVKAKLMAMQLYRSYLSNFKRRVDKVLNRAKVVDAE